MSDSTITTQISQLRAQIEALEAISNNTKKAGNDADTAPIVDTNEELSGSATMSKTRVDVDELDGPNHSNSNSEVNATGPNSAELQANGATSAESESTTATTIPQINRVTWTQFKNSTVGETQRYAIDVLVGPAKFYWQRRREELGLQRGVTDESTLGQNHLTSMPDRSTQAQDNSLATDEHLETQVEMPERIRINCEELLASLGAITESSVGTEPVVMLRPYKLLVHHNSAIKQRLQELAAQHSKSTEAALQTEGSIDNGQSIPATVDAGITGDEKSSEHNAHEIKNDQLEFSADSARSQIEFRSLQCLVQFMDTEIMPVYQRYRFGTPNKIHFRDLWFLYRPGDLVVSWRDLDAEDSAIKSPGKGPPAIWRVLSVSKGRPVLGFPHGFEERGNRLRPPSPRINKFTILCHIIAYDGTSFGPLDHTFEFSSFEGQEDIGTLDPCPIRYVPNYAEIEARLVERGRKFVQYTSPTHCLYIGLTLSKHPSGLTCKTAEKATPVDGHVIVDFEEAKLESSNWVVNHGMPAASGGSGLESTEDYPRSIWKDKAHKVLEKSEPDVIFEDDHIDAADMDDFVATNAFLTAHKSSSGENVIDHRAFERIDFALLPDRVVGWADLKLPRGHKHMVQAQIKTHFLEKQSRQRHALQDLDVDLVRGKGMGLIILLHGAPGVGKTSTAECVAESLRKPLYPITCGDLGVTASEVERVLNSTFAKAETWDCVLLLDEADVFLAQRTRTDLKRNAIVSVFLRVLEYYKGILILTTNRVGAFDEAFKSRIHLHLYYPALNRDQTLAIWKMNLDRVINRKQGRVTADEQEIMRFAGAHFEQHKKDNTRWNGRQIRNAFQTALAMAEYESLEAAGLAGDWEESVVLEDVKSHLKVAHFETVADASSQFDMYIEETIGSTDSKRAFMDRDRADHFRRMVPTNAQSFHHNTWPYGAQGAPDPYTQMKSDSFVSSSRAGQGEFYRSQEPPFRQEQPWPGPMPGQPSQEPNMPHPYLPRGAEPPSWTHKPNHSEHEFSNFAYTQPEGLRPPTSSTPLSHDHRPMAHMPVTSGASQRQDEDGY
ncbi:uncharacterized protein N0V89_005878 [Didymosphaeria variabile]|uniref:AAA+ ATPase domain-containing protein n=1 Tax=Didymosphaeria variabile TaxID=1932322 RepID=A0A9W8XLJ4_9PLEO|nr:uncharacterized protein N0V89_005878 [Didymosphaeria variabile]KAJ4354145.1 hypothetical protein N0V89_005878 [Didymosphaeria variabile]